ncbi:hypothetical protein [Herbidospora sp. RD11066]
MARKVATIGVTLDTNPPRPSGGAGEVVVQVGSAEVLLEWKDGVISDVRAIGESAPINEMQTVEQETGAIVCYRCAVDTETGAWWCWQVICGT